MGDSSHETVRGCLTGLEHGDGLLGRVNNSGRELLEYACSGLSVATKNSTIAPNGILVTGGAGYIGSHVLDRLNERGEKILVLDNLSNGHREAVGGAVFLEGDVRDRAMLESIFHVHAVDTIMHFAGSTLVSESVADPDKYYSNNVGGTANLLRCAVANGVRHFIFSSSAAVYGSGDTGTFKEDSPTKPVNPYGRSKLMCEEIIEDVCKASPMRYVILRYFNVAGAAFSGALGQRGRVSSHLMKIACEAATGKRETIEIFGNDYSTFDGTCIRDYVHIQDLATAHVAALRYLRSDAASTTLNCGYGRGFSVRQVIRAVERAAGKPLPVREGKRRSGDPAVLVAASDRIVQVLDWSPNHDDLDLIADSALAWERSLHHA